jgi:shikimate dehydrogenase
MKTYGLIGKSLSHSFSANFFSTMFENEAIDAKYVNFELASIQEILTVFAQAPSGLNVTIPYKESVLPYIDELDPLARTIGAVNTIVFDGNHKLDTTQTCLDFSNPSSPF